MNINDLLELKPAL